MIELLAPYSLYFLELILLNNINCLADFSAGNPHWSINSINRLINQLTYLKTPSIWKLWFKNNLQLPSLFLLNDESLERQNKYKGWLIECFPVQKFCLLLHHFFCFRTLKQLKRSSFITWKSINQSTNQPINQSTNMLKQQINQITNTLNNRTTHQLNNPDIQSTDKCIRRTTNKTSIETSQWSNKQIKSNPIKYYINNPQTKFANTFKNQTTTLQTTCQVIITAKKKKASSNNQTINQPNY